MYGRCTFEKLPVIYRENQYAWDNLISHIWYTLLKAQKAENSSSVIEIGPGTSSKIGLALAKINYSGILHIIEPSNKDFQILVKKYEAFLPKTYLLHIEKELADCLDYLPKNPDCLLASHIIDDMIMFEHLKSVSLIKKKEILGWSYENGTYSLTLSDLFKQEWHKLEKDNARLEKIKNNIKELLIHIIEVVQPKIMILSQYPSATLYENDMNNLNIHALEIFNHIKISCKNNLENQVKTQSVLNNVNNYQDHHLMNHILNANYWLVYKK